MSLKLNLAKTALRKKAEKGFQGYPMASVIFYGPDDRTATKVVVGITATEESDPEMTRWESSTLDIRRNAPVLESIHKLIRRRQVKSVAMVEEILGCPHEEGVDYPMGDVCPACPFWANRPRPILDDIVTEEESPFPDRRGMEKVWADTGESRSDSPLQLAQEILWDAWDEPNRKRRIELARKALTVSEDCADAFVLLAEETARDEHEAMELYEKGIRAGERALGEETFTRDVGHFWTILETRPYMRARAGLANCLKESGKLDEAIHHYRELLRLNPEDNQGNRDVLNCCLIKTGRDREALALLEQYPDGVTANWLYSVALLAYRTSAANPDARTKLNEAIRRNPHVPKYLLGKKRMPRSIPAYYQLGSPEEAVLYVDLHRDNWQKSEGALEWLNREHASGAPTRKEET